VVGTYVLHETPPDVLVAAMVGRQVDLLKRRTPLPVEQLGAPMLELSVVVGPGFRGVSLAVRAGEVVGIGGLVGAGRTELLSIISGTSPMATGSIRVGGRSFRPRGTYKTWRAGVGLVPEDRHEVGLAVSLDVRANATAPSIRKLARFGLINSGQVRSKAMAVVREANVLPPRLDLIAGSLSGGNQQKLVLGKWLPLDPRVLLLDEPTKGVDVEAKSQIHRRIDALARRGVAILLVSSDLPELLTLSDRILVMKDGELVGELDGASADEAHVIALATATPLQSAVEQLTSNDYVVDSNGRIGEGP
jgi:ABC-type sugar transport system ATPase subunit